MPTSRQAGGRSIVIHHLAGGLVASNNSEQWLFELYVVPCAANQQRDFVHVIDHGQRINGRSILIRMRSKSRGEKSRGIFHTRLYSNISFLFKFIYGPAYFIFLLEINLPFYHLIVARYIYMYLFIFLFAFYRLCIIKMSTCFSRL